MSDVSRRGFLKTTGTVAAATAVASLAAPAPARAKGSNERLRIGFIGPGGRGFGAHVKTLCKHHNDGANIELVAAADGLAAVDGAVLCARAKEARQMGSRRALGRETREEGGRHSLAL